MKLSACIIAKNEEKNLPRLLKSISGKFDEIVLIDTGSTDRTKEIAKSFGCRVFEHEWKGFADARNRAVKEATGDWLWHFDADFELEEIEFKKAISILKYVPEEVEALSIGVRNFDASGKIKAVSSHIFIHRAGIRWKGKVHESPVATCVVGIPVFVNHYGYSDRTLMIKKAKRNLELLKEELQELDESSRDYTIKLFFLVQTYLLLSTTNEDFLKEAKLYAEKFLKNANWNFNSFGFLLAYMFNYYLNILWELGEFKKFEKFLHKCFSLGIELPEIFFMAYKLYRKKKKEEEAFSYLKKTAELLDLMVENPFSLPWGGASECLPLFEREILFEKPLEVSLDVLRDLEREWKRKRGRNLGLLLYWLSRGKKRKLIEKLTRRYRDPFLEKLFLKALVESGEVSTVLKMAFSVTLSELYFATYYDLIKEDEKALKFYISYLNNYRDPQIATYLLNRFKGLLKSEGLPPIM